MAGLIGCLDTFYYGYDWDAYQDRIEQYFVANEIPESKHVAVFITAVGIDTYQTLRQLCHPNAPKDKSYGELCELLRNHFVPKVSVFRQRTIFYAAKQKDEFGSTEPVLKYFARLKKLSMDCKFDLANLNQILLDQFITGLDQGQIMERLCEEKETLSLDTALDIAVNMESALQNLALDLDTVTNTFKGPEVEERKEPKRRRGRGRGGKGRRNKETAEQNGEVQHSDDEASVKTHEE